MSRFEYLSVLISIVIALGLSEMVSAWGRLLRRRARVRFDWIHGVWSVVVALLLAQFWWGFWSYRDVQDWSFGGLLALLVEAMGLVLGALVLTPDPGEAAVDLRQHFRDHRSVFFSLAAGVVAMLAVVDALVGGQPVLHAENAVRLAGFALAIACARARDDRIHGALGIVSVALVLVFAVVGFAP